MSRAIETVINFAPRTAPNDHLTMFHTLILELSVGVGSWIVCPYRGPYAKVLCCSSELFVLMQDTLTMTYYLRKLLPDIHVLSSENWEVVNNPNIQTEGKLLKILENYFKKRRTLTYPDVSLLDTEANQINKLFPSLTKGHILEQLEIFRDMPNRIEIVLRTIVQSKIPKVDIAGVKRISPTELDQIPINNNYCQPIKIRKLTSGPTSTYKVVQKPDDHGYQTTEAPKAVQIFPPHFKDNCSSIPNYTIIRNPPVSNVQTVGSTSNIYPLPCFNNAENTMLNRSPLKARSCTVTSASAIPQVEMQQVSLGVEEGNKIPLKAKNNNLDFNDLQQSSDSSEEVIKESPFSLLNSSVIVSSSDEFSVVKSEEEIVSSSNDNADAILEPKHTQNIINEPSTSSELDIQDKEENKLPIDTQQGTINSSNQIESPVFLDFYSELDVTKQCTLPTVDSSNSSHTDSEISSFAKLQAKDEGLVENIVPENVQEKPKNSQEYDSQKTIMLSPFTVNQFYNEDLPFNENIPINEEPLITNNVVGEEVIEETSTSSNEQMVSEKNHVINNVITNEEIAINNDKQQNEANDKNLSNIDNSYAVPSTSKQDNACENMAAAFNLIEYLQEITNSPVRVIEKQIKKLNLSIWVKPNLPILEMVIDNLLSNKVSSESSDSDDDFIEAQEVPNVEPTATAALPAQTESAPESSSTTNTNQSEVASSSKDSGNLNKRIRAPIHIVDIQLVNCLCGIFPDACPDYIRNLCQNKPMNNQVVDDLTTLILSTNGQYPKRTVVYQEPETFPENQLEILKELLPDADPDYLRMMCDRFGGKADAVKDFINRAMERKDYPTMKDYQRRQQLSAQQRQYTTEFSVENFIKVIPDPHKFFSDPSRLVTMDPLSSHYAIVFLRNTFCKLPVRTIQCTFVKNGSGLTKTYKELENIMLQSQALMKSTRRPIQMPNSVNNIPLLQEIAYLKHQKEINEHLQKIKEMEEAERQEAISKGLMKTCSCCYDEEVLPKDIFTCESECSFCKSCILKSTEVRFGEGKLDFPCLMNCSSHFSLQTLQAVLPPKLFSKIAQKKALEEVKSAGIEELETCPFCDFATIPAEGYSIFSCLNPDCMKESCRFCKEPSHIPLRCDEIEKDEDVKARVFVENQMTEALLKKCYKCGIKFFKEEGCNKMTCSCGASMCYVCGKPVTDYKHFNGNGGERYDLCPLYSDTNVLNKENVLKAAEKAKAEIGNKELKHDPTKDVDQHYKERAKKFPQQQLLVQQQQQAEVFLVRMREALDRLGNRQHHPRYRRHRDHHHMPF